MVKRSKAETEESYRRLVAEQEGSGLSIRAFAAMRGIPPGTLSSWRHELKQRDAARARDDETRAPFVLVNVKPEPSSVRPVVYEVVLGRDRVLRVPAEFDEGRVAALVRAVAPC